MSELKYAGKLIAIDMYNCGTSKISDSNVAEDLLREGCIKNNMQIKEIIGAREDDAEDYSLFAVCALGHVTLHIYPELGYIAADILSCKDDVDLMGMSKYLREAFLCDKIKTTIVDRGDFGNSQDMKPNKRSATTWMRRTQNLGGKIKKVMLKPRSM
ncbi:MAG: S-adenosylmethionine decarboxylase [Phascolarctobacterium sp.]|nr:S-adenosylmethionine decarboxylase [Phascolarctobacterium sp.]